METDQKPVIITSIVLAVLLLVGGILGFSSMNANVGNKLDVMNKQLEGLDIDEQAIANAVVAGIVMPTIPAMPEIPEFPDTGKINELWDEVYGSQVEDLEGEAEDVAILEFLDDNDNFAYDSEKDAWFFYDHDEVYDVVTDDADCDGDCVVEYIKEYEDKREVEVINLGLDDLDDRLVELCTVIRVKVFTDEDDLEEYFFDRVKIDSVVTSDDDELEAEVVYSL